MSRVLPLSPPADREPLLTPEQVAELLGGVTTAWVRRNVPFKVMLGHCTPRWYRGDVLRWVETRRRKETP